ncbi:redoxin domain-containing protein [Actinomadura sp. NAK00032]|uniref:TlpA family protein disulfide reductase n=1 Tax=Actinomadura sp. NAK00032 TaxID=2742128 RepID=UPI0015913E33|nr:redoxin domain-containing protein [Actinomadura sp. NAK00032]QKW38525.1 redoxin domain-containing protein [Actinomadura sp. NAK00032]
MEYLVAGLLLATALTALNLLLTVAAMRRWRAHAAAPPDGGHQGHDHDHDPGRSGGGPELGIAPGDPMPAFTATDAGGATVTADGLAGRPALIAFLSLECPGCDDSVPGFAEHARRVRDDGGLVLATVVGVDAAGSDLAARLAGIADHVVPEFLDAPLGAAFGVRLYPGFVHYGPDGVATAAGLGLDELDAALRPAMP